MRVVVTKVTADRGPLTGHYVLVVQEADDKTFADAEEARKVMATMQGVTVPDMNRSVSPDALPRNVRDALQVWLMSATTDIDAPESKSTH